MMLLWRGCTSYSSDLAAAQDVYQWVCLYLCRPLLSPAFWAYVSRETVYAEWTVGDARTIGGGQRLLAPAGALPDRFGGDLGEVERGNERDTADDIAKELGSEEATEVAGPVEVAAADKVQGVY